MSYIIIIVIVAFLVYIWKKEISLAAKPKKDDPPPRPAPPPPRIVYPPSMSTQGSNGNSVVKSAMKPGDYPKCPICRAKNKAGRQEVFMTSLGRYKCIWGHLFTGKER